MYTSSPYSYDVKRNSSQDNKCDKPPSAEGEELSIVYYSVKKKEHSEHVTA